MKKVVNALSISLCLIFFLPPDSFANIKVKLALIESPPLMSEKAEGNGFEAAIVKAAFENVNIETEY